MYRLLNMHSMTQNLWKSVLVLLFTEMLNKWWNLQFPAGKHIMCNAIYTIVVISEALLMLECNYIYTTLKTEL